VPDAGGQVVRRLRLTDSRCRYKGGEEAAHAGGEVGFLRFRALRVPLDAEQPAVRFALDAFDELRAVVVGVGDGTQAGGEIFCAHGLMVP
jgi:hypothetical protein